MGIEEMNAVSLRLEAERAAAKAALGIECDRVIELAVAVFGDGLSTQDIFRNLKSSAIWALDRKLRRECLGELVAAFAGNELSEDAVARVHRRILEIVDGRAPGELEPEP